MPMISIVTILRGRVEGWGVRNLTKKLRPNGGEIKQSFLLRGIGKLWVGFRLAQHLAA